LLPFKLVPAYDAPVFALARNPVVEDYIG
jgi:hypothetical protein